MKNKLTQNLGWKIVSLLASIVLWMVVNSISDPSVTQTYYNVPVELLNTDLLTVQGKVYEVLDGTDRVSRVTVKAPRSVISELNEDNILVRADVNNINQLNNVPISYDVSDFYVDKINSIKGSLELVNLNVENRISRTIAIATEITGDVAKGYLIGDTDISQNVVRITGAESDVNSVAAAKVVVDVTGFSSNVVTVSDIGLYDEDGVQIIGDDLKTNINSVEVKIDVLQYKNIPIKTSISGKPANGYIFTGDVTVDKSEIEIYGKSSALKNIEAIDIPAEEIDITEAKSNVSVQLNIKNYLPDNVSLMNSDDASVNVTVEIVPATTKVLDVSTEDIKITNVPEGYSATIAVDDGTKIELKGMAKDLAAVDVKDLDPTVDVAAWIENQDIEEVEEGFYTAPVTYTLSHGVNVENEVKAVLHIVKKEE